MATAKKQTKKDLETKIAALEAKLTKLATKLETKPKQKPAEVKPAETAKPKPTLPKGSGAKPAETAKPKPTLPKGSGAKPAETAKPKPTKTTAQPPATMQAALEDAYYNSTMSDFHQYRAKVTGYSPAPNRYFVRRTAPVGKVPSTNWNDQKLKVTGYTSASNQYFATRARMAYHPADKTFGGFSGVDMTFEGLVKQTQQQAPPQEAPKETVQTQTTSTSGASKQQELKNYEADYLKRLDQEQVDAAKAYADAQAADKATANKKGGALPKGFEAATPQEAPKSSKGTLPKGF
ncbi:MAG TPA: trans-sialidase [Nitrosopumilus sp.]|jgi:hypothetical protein|nr:trans-sialidase [Nitrosopumilus sp.]